MTPTDDTSGDRSVETAARTRILPQLGVELIIGVIIAALLVVVGWASSNAIRFVYGGY